MKISYFCLYISRSCHLSRYSEGVQCAYSQKASRMSFRIFSWAAFSGKRGRISICGAATIGARYFCSILFPSGRVILKSAAFHVKELHCLMTVHPPMPMILHESLYLLKHELNIRHEGWLVNDAFGKVTSGNCENSCATLSFI